MSQTYAISYISSASKLSHQEIEDIITTTKINNNNNSINGVLIYVKETFFQILEGDSDSVKNLFEKIKLDARHYNILTFFEVNIPQGKFNRFNSHYIKYNEQAAAEDLLDFLDFNTTDADQLYTMVTNKATNLLEKH